MQRLAFHVLVLCLLTMSQCGSDSVVLLIHVKGLTPDVKALKIDVMLDGKAVLRFTSTQTPIRSQDYKG